MDLALFISLIFRKGVIFVRWIYTLLLIIFFVGGAWALSVSSIYIGGREFDFIRSLAVSRNGKIFLAGYTLNRGNYDAFVARVSADLKEIEAFLRFGGNGNDYAYDLAFSNDGNVIVVGSTRSKDLPCAVNSYSGEGDAFVAEIDADLSRVKRIIYIGGSESDLVRSVCVSKEGNIYICGATSSSDLPSASNTLSGYSDAFVAQIPSDFMGIENLTYFGGSAVDEASTMAISPDGRIYIGGFTWSKDIPKASNLYRWCDGFVALIDKNLKRVIKSIYIGGKNHDYIETLIVSPEGKILVGGQTESPDLPSAVNSYGGNYDGFIAELSANLEKINKLLYSGEKNLDGVSSMLISRNGYIYAVGSQKEKSFYKGVLLKAGKDLRSLKRIYEAGGNGDIYFYSIGALKNRALFLAGMTSASDLPGALNSYQGGCDGFLLKLSPSFP